MQNFILDLGFQAAVKLYMYTVLRICILSVVLIKSLTS